MPKKQRINITCATDDKYVPYCGVMITFVFENHKDAEVHVYILIDSPLSKPNQKQLARLAERYGQHIHYSKVDKSYLEHFPLKGDGIDYWSIVTYYRLYAADLLPEDVDLVLYLDCDIIVDGSLIPLFKTDWTDVAIGAVPDMCTEWGEFYDRLQYDKSLGYFNAGVVLMNLSYWRKNNIGKICLDFLSSHYDRIKNNDQDVLNYVLRNCKRNLPVTFNYQIQLRMPYFFDGFSNVMKQDVLSTTHPIIIHYAAELKPWMHKYYSYPFRNTWQHYKRLSPWRHKPDLYPPTRKWATFIKRWFLWPLGVKLKKPKLILD